MGFTTSTFWKFGQQSPDINGLYKLNKLNKKDSHPITCIDHALNRLEGSKYFSALDLESGYWQIYLDEEDKEKCVIITVDSLFQPIRISQGLKNAPATFQRTMDYILSELKISYVLVYLYGIKIFSKTFTQNLDHLSAIFTW